MAGDVHTLTVEDQDALHLRGQRLIYRQFGLGQEKRRIEITPLSTQDRLSKA